ncbi:MULTISPECIES: hypothetical protein [Sphingomonas]|jgi:hypothetical protein|uniref:Uncharacterized protein n=1 Tax=Sphingomonas ginsenosidimutans TaxID=862134 RepID=A0A2A4I0R4_9SPHN|nr:MULTISPECIES: hypothetical protein [Sphingomonas]MBY0302805.1 hypothetical protein [Sphingomonas ginsenosidimutans]PCG09507.1 hypothetical protein COA17_06410 [Sphingomonas ginsenosidimutans]
MSDIGEVLTGTGLVALGTGEALGATQAFGGAMLTVAGLLAMLAAQEAGQAAAWRIADIAAMRALLAEGGAAVPEVAEGFTLEALDAAWNALSAALDAHHAEVEARGDRMRDAAICAFYRDSTARRGLVWPG